MTEQEERLYLENLLLESARWRMTEDDPYSPIEREIKSRLEQLNGLVESGEPEQSVVERGLAKAEAKKAKKKDHPNTLRVKFPDGSMHRVPRERCHQEPYPQSPTGYRWVIDDDAVEEMKARYS